MPTPASGSIANLNPTFIQNPFVHQGTDAYGHLASHDIVEYSASIHDSVLSSVALLAQSLDVVTGCAVYGGAGGPAALVFNNNPSINYGTLQNSTINLAQISIPTITGGVISGASIGNVPINNASINNSYVSGSLILNGGSIVPLNTGQYTSVIFGQQSSMVGVDLVNTEAYGLSISPTTGIAFYGVEDTASTQVVLAVSPGQTAGSSTFIFPVLANGASGTILTSASPVINSPSLTSASLTNPTIFSGSINNNIVFTNASSGGTVVLQINNSTASNSGSIILPNTNTGAVTLATQSYVTGTAWSNSSASISTASNSASLGGIPAASYVNQSFITSQGYVTSSGSIATASNSASLGGLPASAYALLAAANFTAASVSYSPIITSASLSSGVTLNAASFSGSNILVSNGNITGDTTTLISTGSLVLISSGSPSILIGTSTAGASPQYPLRLPSNTGPGIVTLATQGYVTSTAWTNLSAAVGNSASLGGQPSAYYYPAASITYASVSYATSAASAASVAYNIQVASANYAVTAGSVSYPVLVASATYSSSAGTSTSLNNIPAASFAQLASANFTAASISGSAIATQAFVTSQGYSSGSNANAASLVGYPGASYALLSSPTFTGTVNLGTNFATGSVVTASNSLYLGGIPQTSFAQLSAANFTAASIATLPIATQNFVTTQGYLISSGSIATASNSASLNGLAASAYAQLSSANFTAASISFVPIATQTYVTTQGYLTSSGSIATASNSASLGGLAASAYAQLASANFTAASVGGSQIDTLSATVTLTGSKTFTLPITGSISYATTASNSLYFGGVPAASNVTVTNLSNNTLNAYLTTASIGNLTLTASPTVSTGPLVIPNPPLVAPNTSSVGLIMVGASSLKWAEPTLVGAFTASVNSYLQFILQNTYAGSVSSGDIIFYNDATPTGGGTQYVDLGINSSLFNSGSNGAFDDPNGGYLYTDLGSMTVGTNQAAYNLRFATASTVRMLITGTNPTASLLVPLVSTSSISSNGASFTGTVNLGTNVATGSVTYAVSAASAASVAYNIQVASAGTSASLNNIPAASYAQLASANFTAASISTSPIITQQILNNEVWPPASHGFIGWAIDPGACANTNPAASGTTYYSKVAVAYTATTSSVSFLTGALAANTTGGSAVAALYNIAGASIAITNPFTGLNVSTQATVTVPWITPVSLSAGYYMVGFVPYGASSTYSLVRSGAGSNAANAGLSNIVTGSTLPRFGTTVNTGSNMPPTISGSNLVGAQTSFFWVGIS